MPSTDKQIHGNRGEEEATNYLISKGYKIIARNWKNRYAELDIIAIEDESLVFIEVKTRYSNEYGTPQEAMTPFKMHALIRASQLYKSNHPELPESLRIDFVGVEYEYGVLKHINLIKSITE